MKPIWSYPIIGMILGGFVSLDIMPEEAKKKMLSYKYDIIIDVRTRAEWNAADGHHDKAIHMPLTLIIEPKSKELIEKILPDKGAAILVYCITGNRARVAAERLYDLGYINIQYLVGGLKDIQ
jgi:phage shock protein E